MITACISSNSYPESLREPWGLAKQNANLNQTRVRSNIEKLPTTSGAYKRALEKLDKQEAQIDKLQMQIEQKQEEEKKQTQEYEDYLAGLTVE
jgi:hypothetical protein